MSMTKVKVGADAGNNSQEEEESNDEVIQMKETMEMARQ